MTKKEFEDVRAATLRIWTTLDRRRGLRPWIQERRLNGVFNLFIEQLLAGANVTELQLQLIEAENEVRRAAGVRDALLAQLQATRAAVTRARQDQQLEGEVQKLIEHQPRRTAPQWAAWLESNPAAKRLGARASELVDAHRLKQQRL